MWLAVCAVIGVEDSFGTVQAVRQLMRKEIAPRARMSSFFMVISGKSEIQ